MRGSTAGLTESLRGSSKSHDALLEFLDILFASIIVAPLVVFYWRGTWCLIDYYLFPLNEELSSFFSVAIGTIGSTFFSIYQTWLTKNFQPHIHRSKGIWMTLDIFTGLDSFVVSALTIISVFVLCLCKIIKNISASPFCVVLDLPEGYYEIITMFKTSTGDLWVYLLDCVFSVCIVGTLVVFVWRGVWTLHDIFLFPTNETLSAFASLIIGYSIVIITFMIQPLIKIIVRKLSGILRLIVVDIYLLFSFGGTINVWRGLWNLLNIYFIPENKLMSYWLSHLVSFILLVLTNSSNSVLVRGVYIDCEEEGDQCVDFPCYYLRLFFQEKRKKKILQKRQSLKIIEADSLLQNEDIKKAQIITNDSNKI